MISTASRRCEPTTQGHRADTPSDLLFFRAMKAIR